MSSASDRAGALLTIDLDGVAANWHALNDRVAPSVHCGAAVKADAYGLGAARVAPALYAAGCRRFFLATIDEAISLRPLLPDDAALIVLGGPLPGTNGDFIEHRLWPVLNTPQQVAQWSQTVDGDGPVLVCVKIAPNPLLPSQRGQMVATLFSRSLADATQQFRDDLGVV